ncbi:MAG: outer membrane protein transport protein [Deltaproteobacteria bacterium]|nr:outer membrane protein transport protein [Deltaproteobacteria bacterium]
MRTKSKVSNQRSAPHKGLWLACILLLLLFFTPAVSIAGNPVEGSKAAAMGAAFVAVADDPSTIAHNPAGLTNLKGTNIYGGATVMFPTTRYESPSGTSEDTLHQVFLPPHFYITSYFNTERTYFGVGVFSPFGIGGRKWSEQGLTRYAATESAVATLCINPALAWKVHPRVSVGIGAFFLGEKSIAEKMVNQSALGASDGRMSLKGEGGGWGYNLGLILFPGEEFSFGLAYRSGVRVKESSTLSLENIAPALQPYFGGSTFNTDADTVIHFPPVVNIGMAWRPTKSLTFSFDAEWTGWSSFDRMDLRLRKEVPQAGLTSSSTSLDWKDVWVIKVGAEYQVTNQFSLRTGYAYVQSPVPESTLNPGSPEADRHLVSVGVGYKISRFTLDAFYMADIAKKRQVQNSTLSGKYESFTHTIGFSVGTKY